MSSPFPLLRLPLELREEIYAHYFDPASRYEHSDSDGGRYHFEFALYRACRQVYSEAQTVFRRKNVFVRIETPWPTAVQHISTDGLVPIVVAGKRSSQFRWHHGLVQITAPVHQVIPQYTFVVLLKDLPSFARVWYYSALDYPELNEHLRAEFALRDPYYPADPRMMSVELQNSILLPFGIVKGLFEVDIDGFDESVEKELRRQMAVPHPTPMECLESAADLMIEGDRALEHRDGKEALKLYLKAFAAIHIIISGRSRKVSADPFFHEPILEGRFKGQTGTTVRIVQRIKLVARTCLAYIHLEEWEEAAFWGMRSIKIMREAMDAEFEDFLSEFVGTNDVGFIYLRTAIAFQKMEDEDREELKYYREKEADCASSECLFPLALKYLKGVDPKFIKKEVDDAGARMPKDGEKDDVDSLAPMEMDAEDSLTRLRMEADEFWAQSGEGSGDNSLSVEFDLESFRLGR